MSALRFGWLVLFGFLVSSVSAGTSKSSAQFKGMQITCSVRGKTSSSTSISSNHGACKITANVDGVEQTITITEQRLTWNSEMVPLKNPKSVDITVDAAQVKVVVDGKEVLPKKEK